MRSRLFPIPLLLLAGCLILAWNVWHQLTIPIKAIPSAVDVSGEPANPSLPPAAPPVFSPPAREQFSAVVERPLFTSTRRPPPPAATPVTAPEKASTVVLVGILHSAAGRVALLAEAGDTKPRRVIEGERFGGWDVNRIDPHQVVLRQGDREQQLDFVWTSKPPPGARQNKKLPAAVAEAPTSNSPGTSP
jgi:hypothetical protein